MKTTLVIRDYTNIEFKGLDASTRRAIQENLKIMVPNARHMPSFKMGRWDGTISFATAGGSTYLNLLERVLPIVIGAGYEIDIDDRRMKYSFNFPKADENMFGHKVWPSGHPIEGQSIVLRDHQVGAIQRYLDNLQCIQNIATGAGKSLRNNEPVKTPTGWKPISSLSLDDDVLAPDGSVTKVTGVYDQGELLTYRVVLSDGRSISASGDHLWKIKCNEIGWAIKTTKEIKNRLSKSSRPISIPTFSPTDLSEASHFDEMLKDAVIRKNGKVIVDFSPCIIELMRSLGGTAEEKHGRVHLRHPDPVSVFPQYVLDKIAPQYLNPREPLVRIAFIIEEDVAGCTCISVDHPDKLFVARDYIVTHNTMITAALSATVEPYGRSLIMVPSRDLVKQTEADFINLGLDVGVLYGGRHEYERTHTIATWQSIDSIRKRTPHMMSSITDSLVAIQCDEAHTSKGQVLRDLLTGPFAKVPIRWGMTGTVPKEEHEYLPLLIGIGPVLEEKIKAKDLQDKGVLANCDIEVIQMEEGIPDFADYHAENYYLMNDMIRLKWISEYIDSLEGNVLILVDKVNTGKILSDMISGDVPFVYGPMKSEKRKEHYDTIVEGGDKRIVATSGVASTGISITHVNHLVFLSYGKSGIKTIQSIGRALRKNENKKRATVHDICSTLKYDKRHLKERIKYYKEAEYPYKVTKVKYRY